VPKTGLGGYIGTLGAERVEEILQGMRQIAGQLRPRPRQDGD
jgi:hypothetical protein